MKTHESINITIIPKNLQIYNFLNVFKQDENLGREIQFSTKNSQK